MGELLQHQDQLRVGKPKLSDLNPLEELFNKCCRQLREAWRPLQDKLVQAQKDPVYAMEWGDQLITLAARVKVYLQAAGACRQRMPETMEYCGKTPQMLVQELRTRWTEHALQLGSSVAHSSGQCSNIMENHVTAMWCSLVRDMQFDE